jgi:uncharacterized RmlC-like cupin family protein
METTEVPIRTVVSAAAPFAAAQGSVYANGVSAESVGAKAIYLGLVTLAPGQRTRAHVHAGHETALYMLSGDEIELWTGERLRQRAVARPGDYLYIPADLPHVAVNRSTAAPAVFVAARTEAGAVESVRLCPALDTLVP